MFDTLVTCYKKNIRYINVFADEIKDKITKIILENQIFTTKGILFSAKNK